MTSRKPAALTPKQVAACIDGLTERVARVLMARQIIPSYPAGKHDFRTLDTWLAAWMEQPRDIDALIASVEAEERETPKTGAPRRDYTSYPLRRPTSTQQKR